MHSSLVVTTLKDLLWLSGSRSSSGSYFKEGSWVLCTKQEVHILSVSITLLGLCVCVAKPCSPPYSGYTWWRGTWPRLILRTTSPHSSIWIQWINRTSTSWGRRRRMWTWLSSQMRVLYLLYVCMWAQLNLWVCVCVLDCRRCMRPL